VRTEGYVYERQAPGTVALALYRHPHRGDHTLAASKPGEIAAVTAGYEPVRIEGYVFAKIPYDIAFRLWDARLRDSLIVAPGSRLAAGGSARDHLWPDEPLDALVLKHHVPGTSALDVYFHAGRREHFALGTEESRKEAVAAGYARASTEGYVFGGAIAGSRAVTSYFRQEGRVEGAVRDSLRTEGFGLGASLTATTAFLAEYAPGAAPTTVDGTRRADSRVR
jgi:hypothetical protein